MSNTKKKRNVWRIILIFEIVIFVAAGLTALYVLVLSKTPAVQFVGRLMSPVKGETSIMSRRTDTVEKPFSITNGEKYYKQLVEPDSVNVLVLGESGVCYDTLMIASLDVKNNTIRIINLPRDIYINYSDEVLSKLSKKLPDYASIKGMYKINAAHTIGKDINYENGSGRFGNSEYDFTADLVNEVFGIYIDDYVYLKASAIANVVDYFGGVDINVPYRMKYYDPTQDFSVNLQKGFQHLDGKQAEGFIRFREGYNEKGKFVNLGDPERKKNQTAFVKAFIQQKMTIGNIGRIVTISGELDKYLTSSIDKAQETAEYGKVIKELHDSKAPTVSEEIQFTEKDIDGVYYLVIKS